MKDQPIAIKGKLKLKDLDPGFTGSLDKEETKELTVRYAHRIGELQELLYANAQHAVLLIFQGMDASGKDGAVRAALQHVNPAGVSVTNFKVPSDEERAHDYLWRVHNAIPRYGYIGVFNRSHYEAVLAERVLKLAPEKELAQRFEQIVDWERMLVQNRVVLLKFHLNISREEQALRFKERLVNPKKNWKFSQGDLKTRQLWSDYAQAYEDMLNGTSHRDARWHSVPADRNWYRDYIVAKTVVKALEDLKLNWPKATEDLSKIRVK
ncbi:MAG: polyphosphate kinase 2 family protein [Clostridia bacterium]|nr:polyphosphate kinase 2 family protein [Deltaproteobacteria bacterium]